MEILDIINLKGVIIGIITFLMIGIFHPIVVKFEYYFGTKYWWWFLIVGIITLIGSLFIKDILLSTSLGVFAFSAFWSIKEIFEQRERAIKGWTKKNPKRENTNYYK